MTRPTPRRALLSLALVWVGLFAVGCTEFEDDVVRWHRGRAERLALGTLERAGVLATRASTVPSSRCRNRLPAGPVEVETTLRYQVKTGGFAGEERVEVQRWARDAEGAMQVEHRLEQRLPDGRPVVRTRETRVIGTRAWRALDGRFADVSRSATVADETASQWHAPVDSVLGLLTVRRGALVVAPSGQGFCPMADGVRMPDPAAGRVERSVHGRRGWVRWQTWGGPALIVTWDERVRPFEGSVVPPDEVWPIDADRSYAEVERALSTWEAAGWIERYAPVDD